MYYEHPSWPAKPKKLAIKYGEIKSSINKIFNGNHFELWTFMFWLNNNIHNPI